MSFCVQQTVGVGRWAGVFPGLMGREGWREEMTAGEKWAMKHDEDVHLVPSPGNKWVLFQAQKARGCVL